MSRNSPTKAGAIVALLLSALVVAAPTIQGSDIVRTNTDSTFRISSATADGTTSGTVGGITLQCTADITGTDLCMNFEDSAGNNIFTVSEAGAAVALTTVTATTTLVTAGGVVQSTLSSGPATFRSDRTAASTSASSAAIEIQASQTLDANDLITGTLDGVGTYVNSIDKEGDMVGGVASQAWHIFSNTSDATASSTVATFSFRPINDIASTDLIMNWANSVGTTVASLTEAGMYRSITPMTLASVFVGAVTVAGTNYGGDVLPAYAFTVDQVTLRISVAGAGGTTSWAFRISDGTNICDCTRACIGATANVSLTCAGAGGSGCALPASANLTYSVNSIGDCATGPTIVGNVQVRGYWTP